MYSPEQFKRVAALIAEANDLGYTRKQTKALIAQRLGIDPDSARRYMNALAKAPHLADIEAEPAADPVEVRRHKDKASEARALLKEMEKRLVRAEDIRGEVMGLGTPTISTLKPGKPSSAGRRAVILHISDIQYGEVIDPDAIDGANAYNIPIADARIARYFQKTHRFMTELWQGDAPEEVVVLLNGDMVSGALHHELDRTDGVRPMEAAKLVAEQLIAGLSLIRSAGVPIRVISTPGNHGRTTIKPESKDHTLQNYDTLVGWFIEAAFLRDDLVSVSYTKSVDGLFSVFGFPMLATHGDRIGSRGGQGFLGATGTIVRGHLKLAADYATRGIHLYKIFTGHFHTVVETPFGYANGTMAGWSEYARDNRMRCAPASQDYFVVHEEHGIIESRHITVGDASEGKSHDPRAMLAA